MPEEKDLRRAYRTILGDNFPPVVKVTFGDDSDAPVLRYEKVGWDIGGEVKGLRYGENPGQQAALYRLVNGNLVLGNVQLIQPGRWLASDAELLQSGKHPGKINITDADNALNILRYFSSMPCVSIMKHNNPCGVAIGSGLEEAYHKANLADRVAAFGGTIALNRAVNRATAEAIAANYSEVVVAPEFEEEVMNIFAKNKNLRVMRIANMSRLEEWVGESVVDYKSLIDGGLVLQTSFVPQARTLEDIKKLPLGYFTKKTGERYQIARTPTEQEYRDMWFGWLVESGITSNSVIYVKDGATVGIGTGQQDRLDVAIMARDKAYRKMKDRICFEGCGMAYNDLVLRLEQLERGMTEEQRIERNKLTEIKDDIDWTVRDRRGGLIGSVMVSDAFFPFRDGVDVGLREGVTAVIQPGGSERDFEAIEACNEHNATMVFTGQRSFKH